MVISASAAAQQPVIPLQQLWQEAEQNSTTVRVMQGMVHEAEADVAIARNASLPDVSIGINVGYLGNGIVADRDFGNAHAVENPHLMNGFTLKASQLIYGGGAAKNAVKTSEAARDIANLRFLDERQNVRMAIAAYYLDIFRLRNQTAVLDDNLRLCDKVIENMRAMEHEGTVLSNDLLRYELQKEGIMLSRRKVSDALSTAYRRIATATGHEGDNDFLPDSSLVLQILDMDTDTSYQQTMVQNNIKVRLSDAEISLNEHTLNTIKSGMLPTVAAVAEDHMDGPITIEVPVIDQNFNYWFIGFGVNYNISSLYKNKREIRRAAISVETAKDRKILAAQQMGDDIFAACTDYQTAKAENITQQKSVELAGRNYTVILSRYNNGLATITDLLDAANTKLDAELGLVNSKINIMYNYFKIKYLSSSL